MKRQPLTHKEILKKLKGVSSWSVNARGTEISKMYLTDSFVEGLAFIARVAVHAEVVGHHPDIELSYGKVKIRITTHEVKGLTNADFELAKRIDRITAE